MSSALRRSTTRLVGWLLAMVLILAGTVVASDAANAVDGFGTISGTVTDDAGAPAEGVEVAAWTYIADGGYWGWQNSVYTAEDGSYVLEGLPSGDYKLQFSTAGSGSGLVGQWWGGATDEWEAAVLTLEADAVLADISPVLARGGSISGLVTDVGGAGIAGVEVVVFAGNTWTLAGSARTDETGSYVVSGVAPGEYRIEFQTSWANESVLPEWWDDASSFDAATPVVVTAGGTVAGVDAQLGVGNRISGTVTDESGAPLAGVQVEASAAIIDGTWHGAWTDEAGAYTLAGLPDGDYTVRFTPSAGAPVNVAGEWWDDATSQAAATTLALAGGMERSGVDAQLALAGAIEGTVADETGSPVTDAAVSVSRFDEALGEWAWVESTWVDGEGAFRISGLRDGSYRVQVGPGSDRLLPEWWRDSRDETGAEPVTVTAGATTSGIDVRLDPAGRISGVVTDAAGAPVSGVAVTAHSVDNPGVGVSTDDNGFYDIGGLAAGDYTVQFTTGNASSEVAPEWWNGVVDRADASVVTVEEGVTTTGIDADLEPGARVTGTVTDADGNPRSSVGVLLFEGNDLEPSASGWTADDGSYTVRGVRAGTYRLEFSTWLDAGTLTEWWNDAPTREDADDLVIATGAVLDGIDLTLDERDGSVVDMRDATISGRVLDERGQPIPGLMVGVEDADRPAGDGAPVAEDGTWSSIHLPAGRYRVSFTATIGDRTVTQWWRDAADKENSDVIELAPGEQRTGIDAVLRVPVPPRLDSSTPVISGAPRVGSTLSVDPGDWTPGADFAFQWFAGGAPIDGATSATFTPTAAQLKKRISVEVTGTLTGYSEVSETSAATAPVVRGRLASEKPRIVGAVAVGSTLTAAPGTWTEGTTLRYQWLVNGVPILGADDPTLKVKAAHLGKKIRVVVTGTQPGYLSQPRVSAPTAKVVATAAAAKTAR